MTPVSLLQLSLNGPARAGEWTPVTSLRPERTDAELVERIADGDEAALAQLYDRLADLVYSLAWHVLRDRELASEVVQDAFLIAWRRAGEYDSSRAAVSTWIGRFARTRAIDRLRFELADKRTPPSSELVIDEPGAGDQAVETLWLAERAARVRAALAGLPEQERQLVGLAYGRGYSQSQLAELLGLPLGTVKTRLYRGLARLRETLVADGREEWEA